MDRSQLIFELAAYDLDVSLYANVPDWTLQAILNDIKRIHTEETHKVDLAAAHEMMLAEGMVVCCHGCGKIGADEE